MRTNDIANRNSFIKYLSTIKVHALLGIISFAILTAVAAQITIPAKPVPFTLQTLMVALAGAFLGAKKGAYSQLLYLAVGAIGLPVFAQNPDGLYGFARLFGPTGGYLLAFPIAAFLTGYIIEKNNSYLTVVLAMFAANVVIILCGTLFLDAFYIHNISESLKVGALIFSVWTVVKVFASASIYFGIKAGSKKK
jgi:biotin transport system substrate-specific component